MSRERNGTFTPPQNDFFLRILYLYRLFFPMLYSKTKFVPSVFHFILLVIGLERRVREREPV